MNRRTMTINETPPYQHVYIGEFESLNKIAALEKRRNLSKKEINSWIKTAKQKKLFDKYLLEIGVNRKVLLTHKFKIKDLTRNGFSGKALRHLGFETKEMKEAGFSAKQLLEFGYPEASIKKTGYSIRTLLSEGFSIKELINLGYDSKDFIKSIGKHDFKKKTFPRKDLEELGMTPHEIERLGYKNKS